MDDHTNHEPDDLTVLDPGAIVTAAPRDWIDEPPSRLFVVIDGISAPHYTIAVLGGDGFQYPNVDGDDLTVVHPARITRDPTTDRGYLAG